MKRSAAIAKLEAKLGRGPTDAEVDAFVERRKERKKRRKKADDESARTWGEARSCLAESLVAACEAKGWPAPTPIQALCWPVLASGRDAVAVAETGSGKTLAFALPALSRCDASKLSMLVLSPTRELAQQSFEVVDEMARVVGARAAVAFGGVAKARQASAIEKCSILVATPGRLWDLVEHSTLLGDCSFVVLDEADRMLDMGFVQVVRSILSKTPPERQTAMFSATWPPEVRAIAAEMMRSPVKVSTAPEEPTANAAVSQTVVVCEERRRDSKLLETLSRFYSDRDFDGSKTIVFGLYKKECARLEGYLNRNGWTCVAIHGDMTQASRTKAFDDFRSGRAPVLVATDVAARGLDIPAVSLVLNYSFPLTIEDYVHRVGRTGRAGKSGTAITFFHGNQHEKALAGALQNILRQNDQPIPDDLKKFGNTVKKKSHALYGDFGPKATAAPLKKPTKITFDD
ncbi:hypothetical protein CTAYLR_008153 [Chrysophaeum taylorii]|uniref:RNA helicase n=1 Tax=Chrysophaeum taylorii TaxID=2483200 RepID=A0AAD7UIK9_9STRA|nr:hypothetical protein CTAYLR_008153 [Chrysophaeum taylorii]